jgi:hypothetical protein
MSLSKGKRKSSLRRIVPIIKRLNMPIGPAGVICLAEQSLSHNFAVFHLPVYTVAGATLLGTFLTSVGFDLISAHGRT